MAQSRASRTARLRSVAFEFPLPTNNTSNPLGLGHSRIASIRAILCAIPFPRGTRIPPLLPVVPCRPREIVKIPLWRGVGGCRHCLSLSCLLLYWSPLNPLISLVEISSRQCETQQTSMVFADFVIAHNSSRCCWPLMSRPVR